MLYLARSTLILLVAIALSAGLAASRHCYAQTPGPDSLSEAALAENEADAPADRLTPSSAGDEQAAPEADAINLFELLVRGGWIMIPIGLMSILVVALGIERAVGLRRQKVLPEELVAALGRYNGNDNRFDPKRVYRLCQEFPSTAANVIRSMLVKLGRPHSEVEHAVHEAAQREAGRLHNNVRTLNLAAAVTPLLGLFGTVWGMIQAFFVTASMPVGANKAEALAEGIYVALVTTFAGLAVAIPAAVLAHIFEGRIETLLRTIEELLGSLLPQVERFEGTVRMNARQLEGKSEKGAAASAPEIAEAAPPTGEARQPTAFGVAAAQEP